jgi:hypothetical protein
LICRGGRLKASVLPTFGPEHALSVVRAGPESFGHAEMKFKGEIHLNSRRVAGDLEPAEVKV